MHHHLLRGYLTLFLYRGRMYRTEYDLLLKLKRYLFLAPGACFFTIVGGRARALIPTHLHSIGELRN